MQLVRTTPCTVMAPPTSDQKTQHSLYPNALRLLNSNPLKIALQIYISLFNPPLNNLHTIISTRATRSIYKPIENKAISALPKTLQP